jgi:EmrB/QacA subfamily drug resistance transporter
MRASPRWTLAATIIGSSLTFIDGTVVNVAIPALQASLHATITDVQWVIEAYALFLGALILVGGSAGDQFGRKRVFLIGVVVFACASALCGLSDSAHALIAARAVQGVGAACLVPASLAIITATFDDESRGRAIGVWSGFSAITAAIGPVIGGWLIDHISWRAAFLLNVPLAAVVLIISWRFVGESRDPSRSHNIDWRGAALATCGLGSLVFGLLEWPRVGASQFVAGALGGGVICLVVFVIVERRSSNPMLSLDLFRSRTFSLTNALTLFLYGALAIVFFLVPINLIELQKYSSTEAGAALLPFPLTMFVLSRWSGGLVARVDSRVPLTAGPVIAAAGIALYVRPSIGGTYWATFFPATLVVGFGMALTVAPLTTTVMNAVEAHHSGVASGVNNAVSRVAGLLAIAVFGVLLTGAFRSAVNPRIERLTDTSTRTAVDRELTKMTAADLSSLPLASAQRLALRASIDEAFVRAFRLVIVGAATLALIAGVTGALLPRKLQTANGRRER